VFSMDGDIARIDAICELAERHGALVMVDDSHATGSSARPAAARPSCGAAWTGSTCSPRPWARRWAARRRVHLGRREIVDLLRNRSRPYLFSNTLAPPVVAGSLAAIALIRESTALRDKLEANTERFRAGMTAPGCRSAPARTRSPR